MLHHEVLNPEQFNTEGLAGPLGSYGEPWSPMGVGYVGTDIGSGAGVAM